LDRANERLMNAVNESGVTFLSHTRIEHAFALRFAIGHVDTRDTHVRRAWELIVHTAAS
jgi:aromatic-L-amino-acid decarboxylase